jgi:hypothetical protein
MQHFLLDSNKILAIFKNGRYEKKESTVVLKVWQGIFKVLPPQAPISKICILTFIMERSTCPFIFLSLIQICSPYHTICQLELFALLEIVIACLEWSSDHSSPHTLHCILSASFPPQQNGFVLSHHISKEPSWHLLPTYVASMILHQSNYRSIHLW